MSRLNAYLEGDISQAESEELLEFVKALAQRSAGIVYINFLDECNSVRYEESETEQREHRVKGSAPMPEFQKQSVLSKLISGESAK